MDYNSFVTDEKRREYLTSLIGRYVIVSYYEELHLCKITSISSSLSKLNVNGYIYLNNKKYYESFSDANMWEFDIKSDFSNFEEAWTAYEIERDAKKYNL
jgi:hypothetical protein